MRRIVKYAWTLTVIFFLVSLSFIYANVGEVVNLDGSTRSISEMSMSKDVFFYAVLAFFLVINIMLRGIGMLLDRVPVSGERRKTLMTNAVFKEKLVNWSISFTAVVNLAIIFSLIIIGFANYMVNPRSMMIGGFGYLGFGLVAGWLVALVVLLVRRKTLA